MVPSKCQKKIVKVIALIVLTFFLLFYTVERTIGHISRNNGLIKMKFCTPLELKVLDICENF